MTFEESSQEFASFSPEEMIMVAKHLEAVLGPDTRFVLILSDPKNKKAGAICTMPPELSGELKAVMAELSKREPQFNN